MLELILVVGVLLFGILLIWLYRNRPKKLAIGTKALIVKDIWVVRDPQLIRLRYKAEMLDSMKKSGIESDALITQKSAAGDLLKLPEKTAISILGYVDVPTCKFQVLDGNYSGGVYYGPSQFIKAETESSL